MRPWLVVAWKEIFESLRDRRTLLSALVLAPLLGPVMFAGMMNVALERGAKDADRKVEAGIIGAEHAPNLVAFLKAQGLVEVTAPASLAAVPEAVRDAKPRLVLVIPANYGERFRGGEPAGVQLYVDTSDNEASRDGDRVQRLVGAFGSQVAAMRLAARGLSPGVVQSVVVDEVDVSTPASRAQSLLAVLSYFLLFSTLIGGMYLAIDATAGERERGSLEPLLTLPVSRGQLVAGKLLATMAFSAGSLALTLGAFMLSLRFVPLESVGMSANLGPEVALRMYLAILPFVPLAAALMTLVASFARSFREAQSWMTGVLLVPTMPIMIAAVTGLKPAMSLMAVPSLSQHFLVTRLLRDEPIAPVEFLVSAGGTLALAAVLTVGVLYFWRRERLLG